MKFLGDVDTSNLLLLDVKYAKQRNENNRYEDYAMLLMKNVISGEKMVLNINEPKMEIFFTKPECRDYTHNMTHIEIDKTYSKVVKYKDMILEIAKEAGDNYIQYYKNCIDQRKFKSMKNIHKYPYVFASDTELENYYRIQWNMHYHNPDIKVKLTKQFLDIEVDGINVKGMPKDGECPINAVTIIDAEGKSGHTFLLRNKDNPLIEEFENNIDDFIKLCNDTFDEYYGHLDYNIYMFDNEVDLIHAMFSLIHTLERDFVAIWNMGFDIPYIIARIKELGYDPKEIMCHSDFKAKELYYFRDMKTFEIVEKKDYFNISSKSVFVDQMLIYGKIRKGRGVLPSLRLNSIAKKELGDEKLDYSDEADIKTLPYVNYIKFVLYNIKDTLLQYGIDDKTKDIDNMYLRSMANVSMYKSIFSQTIFLKNRYYLECLTSKTPYVPGNNANIDYDMDYDAVVDKKKGVKFDGAVVGDPLLNEYVGVEIFGKKSKFVHKNVVDMD